MQRLFALLVVLSLVALSGCSEPKPVAPTNPTEAPEDVSTDGLPTPGAPE